MTDYVYVFEGVGVGLCKIGRSYDPDSRLISVRNTSAWPVRGAFAIPCGKADHVERAAHIALSDARFKGEWFRVTPEHAIDVVKLAASRVRAGHSPAIKLLREMRKFAEEERQLGRRLSLVTLGHRAAKYPVLIKILEGGGSVQAVIFHRAMAYMTAERAKR